MPPTEEQCLTYALQCHQNGYLQQAELLYKQLLQRNPQHADVLHLLGVLAYQRAQYDIAVELINKAITSRPGVAIFYNNCGTALKAQGKLDAALRYYQEAVRLQPDFAEAYHNMGNVLQAQGQLKEAITNYQQALTYKPDYAEAYTHLGAVFRRQGHLSDAMVCCQQALRLKPDYAEAYHNLGNVFWDQGDLDQALICYQEAIRLKPDYAESYSHLGDALQARGRLTEAEMSYRQAIQRRPDYAEAYNNLGTILQRRGDLDQAIASYQKALQLKPDFAEAYNNLGLVLHEQGKLSLAIASYRRAVQHKPDYTEAYTNLGAALQVQGHFAEAQANYQEALRLTPDCIEALAGEASLLEKQGDFVQAYERLYPLLQAGTTNIAVITTLATLCRHYDHRTTIVTLMERLLAQENLSTGQRRSLLFALGKLCDELKAFDKAFAYFQQANALKPCHFDPGKHAAFITALIDTYSVDRWTQLPRATYQSERPVFIVGMPRSGTSLVEQILASHPLVFGAGELPDITQIAASLGAEYPSPDCVEQFSVDTLNSLTYRYLCHLEHLSPDAVRITDKMPGNFLHLGLIALLFPQARIIHCVRDPLDTCLSCYFQDFIGNHDYAYDLTHLGGYYRAYQTLMDHWKTVLNIPMLEVQYEELVTHQEQVSRQIIAFCALEWNEQCLRFHETNRYVNTASYDQVRRPLYTTSIGRHHYYSPYLAPLQAALAGESRESIRTV